MLDGLIEMARHGQVVVVTPFTLSGAMAPVTIAGALVAAERRGAGRHRAAQIVRPGAPVIYGGFTSNVDMKTGAPAFGTPELRPARSATGQMARRYGLPWRSCNVNAANAADAQAAYESQMSLWGAVTGHANRRQPWRRLARGRAGRRRYEKLILDIEMVRMMCAFLKPLDGQRDDRGLDSIEEVGPGGHFFGAGHTLARYETAFYTPLVSDWSQLRDLAGRAAA